ncbi:SAM-dependent methyltransferase [Longispora urticae]
MPESFPVEVIGHVIGGRTEPTDDNWGGSRCVIRIDPSMFPTDATLGLEDFSHLEVVWHFHLQDLDGLFLGARSARDNPAWPKAGSLAHRNMKRVNRIGVSRCRLLKVDGLDLHVEDLDAVHGSPVLDIKPWFPEFGPRGPIHQADWSRKMLGAYFAPMVPVIEV